MKISEQTLEMEERRINKKEEDFLYNRYVMLQWEYFLSFAVSGVLLLNYFGYLGWCTGIAWVSISNIIATLLVRIDVTINVGRLIKLEKKRRFAPLIESFN